MPEFDFNAPNYRFTYEYVHSHFTDFGRSADNCDEPLADEPTTLILHVPPPDSFAVLRFDSMRYSPRHYATSAPSRRTAL